MVHIWTGLPKVTKDWSDGEPCRAAGAPADVEAYRSVYVIRVADRDSQVELGPRPVSRPGGELVSKWGAPAGGSGCMRPGGPVRRSSARE